MRLVARLLCQLITISPVNFDDLDRYLVKQAAREGASLEAS
jgi:hypothetical protein